MILKSFELNKLDINKNNLVLLHGNNEGAKKEALSTIISKEKKVILNYNEKQILDNTDEFYNAVLSKSLFEDEKIFVIKNSSNKVYNLIAELYEKKLSEIRIIINSIALEKKSKLRNLFETEKDLVSVAFYPDTPQILSNLAQSFFKNKNIAISQSDINLIVNKCGEDREILYNELEKINLYCLDKGKLLSEDIIKLINLSENHNISKLIDYCLTKNKKATISILNENNYTSDDGILIVRTFLNKTKKILTLSEEYQRNKNIEKTITTAKPPIFWKEKEITKEQILKWEPKKLKNLIYKLGVIEYDLKKNFQNSIYLITNFILDQVNTKSNNET